MNRIDRLGVYIHADDAYVFRTRISTCTSCTSCDVIVLSRTRVSRLLERTWQISVSPVTRNTYVSADPRVIIQSKHEHRRRSVIHRITRAVYEIGAYGFKHAARSGCEVADARIGERINIVDAGSADLINN